MINGLLTKGKLWLVVCCMMVPLSQADEALKPTQLAEQSLIAFFSAEGKQVVGKNQSFYYRKLLEKGADGSFLVQDFYTATDNKQTDPMRLLKATDLTSWNPVSVEGSITWYDDQTGAKSSFCSYKAGKQQGYCYDWYDNGQLKNQYYYQQGLLDGVYSSWYKSGIKEQEISYRQGKQQGLVLIWSRDGHLLSKGYYQADKKEGLWLIKRFNGNVEQATYHKGLLEGPYTEQYANGVLKEQGFFQQGKQVATWQYRDEKGQLVKEVSYLNNTGKRTEKYFYDQSKLRQVAHYDKYKLEGKWQQWFANGQLAIETTYAAGKPIGGYSYWYENGQLREQGSFKNDLLEGAYRQYYENGKKRLTGQYQAGNYQGKWLSWYDNGQQESIINYNQQGERDGLFRLWDKAGKPVKQAIYKDGLKVTDVESCALPLLEGKGAKGIICYFNSRGDTVEEAKASTYYRKVIAQQADKSLMVANFYTASNNKMMDPIKLTTPYAVSSFKLVSAEGNYNRWYENGNKWQQGVYKNGQLDGTLTTWSEAGYKVQQITYHQGVLNGLSSDWNNAGKLMEQKYFKQGKLDGPYRKYRNGILYEEGNYKEGLKDGLWSFWAWDGYKETEEHYKKNKRDGLAKKWNEDGHLIWQGSYQNGYLQWEKQSISIKGL